MYYGNFLPIVAMRMCIFPSRTTMSRPPNMSNPDLTRKGCLLTLLGYFRKWPFILVVPKPSLTAWLIIDLIQARRQEDCFSSTDTIRS